MNDWNPNLYMQFRSERTQPSIDLISKIISVEPKSIIDVGCGPGNSTQVLVNRWPKAKITGLDNSSAMIQKAKHDYPNQEWIVTDALTYESEIKYDIVFSNAAIQWIPNHENLLKKFHGSLKDEGLLAIQIPLFWDMPLGKVINETANDIRWKDQMEGIADLFTIHNYSFYYDHLSSLFNSIDIWETNYLHILDSHIAIIEMMRSTGMKPYLEKLDNDLDINQFEKKVLIGIKKAYPKQKNGKVLLPFKRLFFIGYKSQG
ncbi:MAG: methyltransferase domain-containing protein [Proteobacteria bacterium]|nr:methyltransferase domain-containing protein [Pseudomonadota bacterium]